MNIMELYPLDIELLHQCHSCIGCVCMNLCSSRDVKTTFPGLRGLVTAATVHRLTAHQQTGLVSLKSSQAHVDSCHSHCLGVIYHLTFLSHPHPLSIKPLSRLWSNKKEKATVSPKPHSARQTAELVWKSLSHWVYFSSEWPGLLALGEFRADFGRRQTVISPLIHFNQQ